MSNISELQNRMKADWDRRIAHDYRFWMSDGYASDQAMWDSGQRDLEVLLKDYQGKPESEVILDVGCGVGRLLHAALPKFKRVLGIDISEQAIKKAETLLQGAANLELHISDGTSLKPVQDNSINLIACFAVLGSVPTDIFAAYLSEFNRVLMTGGEARLQLYFGRPQQVSRSDTLFLRSYEEQKVREAIAKAGFAWMESRELVLPFKVSSEELGFKAVILTLRKTADCAASPKELSRCLLPEGESEVVKQEAGHELEYWMSVNYARELVDRGELERAQETLRYAADVSRAAAIDAGDLIYKITQEIAKRSAPSATVEGSQVAAANMALLQQRFPLVAELVKQHRREEKTQGEIEIRSSAEGPVLFERGQCLDHPAKPQSAAQTWVKRVQQETKADQHIVVFGAGCGYHLDALGAQFSEFSVVEPSVAAFSCLLGQRPIEGWLAKTIHLSVGTEPTLPERPRLRIELRPQTQALYSDVAQSLRARYFGEQGLSLLHPTIGVLGPLHGGTLPIMAYSTLTLQALNQRARQFDVSCFDQGYTSLEQFVKEKARRAPVESMYQEMVSQVILEAVTEKPIDILFCMALAPISARVLTELRSRGVITVLWFVEDYHRFDYWKEMARYYDFVFTIQRGKCVDALKQAGAGEVHYLPVACEPSLHAPLALSEEERNRWGSPVSFMGAGYHNRQQMFAALADFPIKIWGTEWPDCKPFDRMVQEGGRRLPPGEYVKVFNASDINLNLHSSNERDGVDPFGDFLNPRTFELAACGAFQLVDKRTLLSEAFEEGREIVTFNDTADLKEKIQYYLAHPEERKAIAERARQKVLSQHTYAHRMREMLKIIYSSKYEQLKMRHEASPWKRMLDRAEAHPELLDRCQRAFERGEEPTLDGLVSDIVTGQGKLTETEKKLLFLFHIRKQIIRMTKEEAGEGVRK